MSELLTQTVASERLQRRFWAKVSTPDARGCMEWTAARDNLGYGRFSTGRSVARLAHRVAYAICNGEDPGEAVRHACDNPPCVNPLHLLSGTHADNVADKVAKRRHAWPVLTGSRNPRSKLSDDQVAMIAQRLNAGARSEDLQAEFHVSQSTIETIKYGKRQPTAARLERGTA